jgi:hypothetical protein
MPSDKRRGDDPIPENCKEFLTQDQIVALGKLESFGWSLKFVRRPKFAPVEVVVISDDGESYAIMRDNGELDSETPVERREAAPETPVEASDGPPENDLQTLADDLQTLDEITDESPAEASPMVEPVPSSSNEALPDEEEIPPPKFLV